MKTDLNSLKKELSRLTDINYLKKELNRIAGEVKNFDKHITLTPQARQRLEALEERFRDLLKSLSDLQKQVDTNLEKIMSMVRGTGAKSGGRKKTARATTKRAASPKKKTARKTTRKTSKKSASK